MYQVSITYLNALGYTKHSMRTLCACQWTKLTLKGHSALWQQWQLYRKGCPSVIHIYFQVNPNHFWASRASHLVKLMRRCLRWRNQKSRQLSVELRNVDSNEEPELEAPVSVKRSRTDGDKGTCECGKRWNHAETERQQIGTEHQGTVVRPTAPFFPELLNVSRDAPRATQKNDPMLKSRAAA